MNTTDWLRAARDGRVDNDWALLAWSEGGYALEMQVSAMPARVDGRVRSLDAYTQQLVGDVLAVDGEPLVMPTPKLRAVRHAHASVVVPPIFNVAWLSDPRGEELWEVEFLRQLSRANGMPDRWLVSCTGKPWTLWHASTADDSFCEGFLGTEEVLQRLGVPHGPTEVPGVFAVRVPGATGALGGHHKQLRQCDYSGHGEWFHPRMRVAGADWLVRDALLDPEIGPILCGASGPLPFWRHPGVPLLADSPEWRALTQESQS